MQLNQYEPFHNHCKTPSLTDLARRLEAAASSLFDDLQSIDPLRLNISEYNQRYLQEKLQELEHNLVLSSDIVGSVLCESRKSLEDFIFVEYGGGTGLLSLLSKRLGVGTVVYSDIYDVSCKDAEEIARVLGCRADYYVQGDIDDLAVFCNSHRIRSDGIGSYDVLEHIYDLDDFCRKLHLISHEGTAMMHASGGNMFFYPTAKGMKEGHIRAETEDREEEWGHKKRDHLLAYSKARGKIISEYCPSLNEREIERMVTSTRGLMRDDILKCLDRYVECKELPKLIEHPTNTCDPYTGNWAEHSFNPYHLQETLSFNGFDAEVLPRYWGKRNNPLRNTVASTINRAIRISSTHIGLHICPYMAIYAKYDGEFSDERHRRHLYKCRRSPVWYVVLVLWEVLSRLRH